MYHQPVLVAQGFQWSRCTATLMDVHAQVALSGAWREGNSGSTMSLYPTRGQWQPYRGRDMEKAYFPPSLAHLSGGRGFQLGSNPETAKNFFSTKFNCSHQDYPCSCWLCYLTSFQYNLFGFAQILPSCSSFFLFNLCARHLIQVFGQLVCGEV